MRLAGAVLALLLTAQSAPRTQVSDLSWMSGRWLASENGRWTEEIWSGPRGGTLMGFSWSGEGQTIREYEYLRVQAGEDDEIVYLAQPNGGAGVGFHLVRAEGTSATFENPTHDFPQRIRYVRTGDTMVATISRTDGSNAMSWTYTRR
ncbi:MAG: hypothetical protein QOJ53_1715 [Sphingomonadales bacterium]|jgi:hypothetical protein|nr:hypothetical protein [Sphingomonadales bacterium]MEA3044044.1 hypothetical protein [Sphingomonadales bacterium]MEA3047383.1 hypothetical protein [Sphingomonadales bacterium]